MESSDGFMFVCKLCGENHEVPEEIAPYWSNGRTTLNRVWSEEMALGCPDYPDQTAQYSFTDLHEFRVS
jgi:hypothetical protein